MAKSILIFLTLANPLIILDSFDENILYSYKHLMVLLLWDYVLILLLTILKYLKIVLYASPVIAENWDLLITP